MLQTPIDLSLNINLRFDRHSENIYAETVDLHTSHQQGAERLMPPRESKAPVDPEVLDGGARWEHDLFDDWEEPRRNLQQRLRGPADGFRL